MISSPELLRCHMSLSIALITESLCSSHEQQCRKTQKCRRAFDLKIEMCEEEKHITHHRARCNFATQTQYMRCKTGCGGRKQIHEGHWDAKVEQLAMEVVSSDASLMRMRRYAFVFHPRVKGAVRVLPVQNSVGVSKTSQWKTRHFLASKRRAVMQMSDEMKEEKSMQQNAKHDIKESSSGSVMTSARYGVAAIYVGFAAFAFLFAPGPVLQSKEMGKIFAGNLNEVNDLFFAVFNLLGLIPLCYAALLNPGVSQQRRLPFKPFALTSLVVGFFGIGPYLIGRDYADSVSVEEVEARGFLSRALESRTYAVGIVLFSLWMYAFAFGAFTPGTQQFRDSVFYASWVTLTRLFSSDWGVCVSCLDFVALSVLLWGPLTEDMTRRGWFPPEKWIESALTAISFLLLPGLGPAVYLAVRPRLPTRKS